MLMQAHGERAGALARAAPALLPALFGLVQRLEEVESKVRVLQLVSVSIEALGDAAGPLLGSVATALPMVSLCLPVQTCTTAPLLWQPASQSL